MPPQTGQEYVSIGRNIDLYNSIVQCGRIEEDRLINGDSCASRWLVLSNLSFTWGVQVKRVSSNTPKYLTCCVEESQLIGVFKSVRGGGGTGNLRVKIFACVLSGFKAILHWFVQLEKMFKAS